MRIFLIVGGIVLVLTIVLVAIKKTATGTYSAGAPDMSTSSALRTASPSDLQTQGGFSVLGFDVGTKTFPAPPRGDASLQNGLRTRMSGAPPNISGRTAFRAPT